MSANTKATCKIKSKNEVMLDILGCVVKLVRRTLDGV